MAYGGSKQTKGWEERLNEASTRFEVEIQRVVRYIDAEIVPEVRRQGSTALRAAATKLQKLAEHMDDEKAHSPASSAERPL